MEARGTQGLYLVAEVLGDGKYRLARENGETVTNGQDNIFLESKLTPQ